MDSDDDFMSGVSSDEDDVLQDGSDNDEGSADGTLLFLFRPRLSVISSSLTFLVIKQTLASMSPNQT